MESSSAGSPNVEPISNIREGYLKNYMECKRLLEVESKNDPIMDPYRSKYKVRDIFLEDAKTLRNHLKQMDPSHPDYDFCKLYISLVYAQIGIMHVETEELSKGVNYLNKCLDVIENPLHPSTVFISVEVRNHLGYVSLLQSKPEEAVNYLEKAEKLYYNFRSDQERKARNIFEYVENPPILGEEELEMVHTMTKFYLSQAYGALNYFFKSSIYCHETLKRQLILKNFDPIDWAQNSATLSEFFVDRMLLKQGRHHLAAANYVLDEYENNIKNMEGSQEEIDAKKEELRHQSADLCWCWAKYGLGLLAHSIFMLFKPADLIIEKDDEDIDRLFFDDLDLTHYENQFPDAEVVTFEDAREVFLTSQRFLKKAKEYYTLEDRASDHVQIVRDHSQLFWRLSAFEEDREREFKMLKKRVDMLEIVLKELNPRFYMDLCHQLWLELGELYHDMMQLKSDKMKKTPTPQILNKVNSLMESSMKYFNYILDSVRDKRTGKLPDPIERDLISLVLTCHFYLGRLYFNYVTLDKRNQEANIKKAVEYYKYLVDYCDQNEEAKDMVKEKYEMAKEILPLLQMRLLKL